MLQRLQTTLKKGLLLSFLALDLPQVGKADSPQAKKDAFLIDASRSMQGHGSVSTPYRADQAAPCGAVITMDRKRRNIITDDDIAASASATVRLFQKNLSRYRTHLKSDEELYKESVRLEKEAEERKRRKAESQKPKRQQASGSRNANNQSAQPSQGSQDRPLSSYTEEELFGKDGEEYLDKGIYEIAKANGDIGKKLSSNPTHSELREYWDSVSRIDSQQMRPVAERVARNAEAMRMSQEAYKRRLQEKRANATIWDKIGAGLEMGSAKILANLTSVAMTKIQNHLTCLLIL